MSPFHTNPNRRPARAGFTVVELLVVMAIIVLLAASVVTVGSAVWRRASAKKTESLLQVVQQAVDDFHRDPPKFVNLRQKGDDPSEGEGNYLKRYGAYPPDELEVFTSRGVPGAPTGGNRSLAPGKAGMIPSPTSTGFSRMTFGRSVGSFKLEHRDLAAMLLAIELYSESGREVLSRIESRYWVAGASDAMGKPEQFLDRNDNGMYDPGDQPVRWLVDDWQTPLSYYTQRDYTGSTAADIPSTNDPTWNRASTEMVRLNGGRPVIMSYGPNGADQLAGADPVTGVAATTLLHTDWDDNRRIDDPLNADNLYAAEGLADKLAKGIAE